jgi:galactoside O-acetyltransferase
MNSINSFYSQSELLELGFKSCGINVNISKKASFYGIENIVIGNNVRIDDFCILSGQITLGNYIHISAYSALYGSMGIEMEDFSGLSPRCTVFSSTDDFSGFYCVGPLLDSKLTNITGGKVKIGKYAQVGAGCTIMPNLFISEGVAVGAMSFVNQSLSPWTVCYGIPAKEIKKRGKKIIDLLQ